MIRRADADIGLFAQQKVVVPPLVEKALEHDKVQLSGLQMRKKVRGVVDREKQLVFRAFEKTLDLWDQNIVSDRLRRPDAKKRLGLCGKQARQLCVVILELHRVALQNLALHGFAELSLVVGKELHAVLRF